MEVKKIVNDFIEENSFIIYQDNIAVVVDPGSNFDSMRDFLNSKNIEKVYVYLTHGHVDHIVSVPQFKEVYNAPVYTHKYELPLLEDTRLNMSEGIVIDYAIGIEDYLEIPDFGKFRLYHTPGHTYGHSMLKVDELNALFTGDFIFKHEIGRCDLATGNIQEMFRSLEMIKLMDPNLNIYCGHGPDTTVGEEIAHNMYLNR
ncbi:MAG: MBL fold metallo-hydrolase [Erysipelotrichales bacterium]